MIISKQIEHLLLSVSKSLIKLINVFKSSDIISFGVVAIYSRQPKSFLEKAQPKNNLLKKPRRAKAPFW